MKKTGIYKITCIENGRYYIGQAINLLSRWSVHKYTLKNNCHFNKHIQRCYDKYGLESLKFEVIQECSIEQATQIEQDLLDIHIENELCMNQNPNANTSYCLGKELTKEVKDKISQSLLKNYKNNPELRQRISDSQKGKKMPERNEQWKQKQSLSQKGKEVTEATRNRLYNQVKKSDYKFISPDGIIYEGNNITKFTREMNLNKDCMIKLMNEKRLTHKGWKKYT